MFKYKKINKNFMFRVSARLYNLNLKTVCLCDKIFGTIQIVWRTGKGGGTREAVHPASFQNFIPANNICKSLLFSKVLWRKQVVIIWKIFIVIAN